MDFGGTPGALEIIGIHVQKCGKVGLSLCQEARRIAVPHSFSHQQTNAYLIASTTPSFTSSRSFFSLFKMEWCPCCLVARAHGSKHSCSEMYNLLDGSIPSLVAMVRVCAALLSPASPAEPQSSTLICAIHPHTNESRGIVLLSQCLLYACKINIHPHAFKTHLLSTNMCLLGISGNYFLLYFLPNIPNKCRGRDSIKIIKMEVIQPRILQSTFFPLSLLILHFSLECDSS